MERNASYYRRPQRLYRLTCTHWCNPLVSICGQPWQLLRERKTAWLATHLFEKESRESIEISQAHPWGRVNIPKWWLLRQWLLSKCETLWSYRLERDVFTSVVNCDYQVHQILNIRFQIRNTKNTWTGRETRLWTSISFTQPARDSTRTAKIPPHRRSLQTLPSVSTCAYCDYGTRETHNDTLSQSPVCRIRTHSKWLIVSGCKWFVIHMNAHPHERWRTSERRP